MAYIGNTVQNQGFAPAIDYFSGNGSTVTFTLSRPVASVAQMIVAIDNVIQNPSTSFTVAGSAITFTSAPLSGTNNIWVEYTSLITTYAAISQSPSVIGDITASGGYLAVGSFGNSFIDGTIVDYVTGNGRVTVGPADGFTLYTGGTSARTALAAWDSSGNLTNTGGAVIQGLTVGKGGGAVVSNSAFGQGALNNAGTGNYNTAIGFDTLYSNTTGSGGTAVGGYALYSNTTGTANTGIGGFVSTGSIQPALFNNTTGSYNIAVGTGALAANTTASNNTAVGYQAGYSNTTGNGQVIIGNQAGYTNQGGAGCTFVGNAAGYNFNNASGGNNTYIGYGSGYLTTTGSNNTFVGTGTFGSGHYITTGSKNSILGCFNGNQNNLDIRTASNRIVLSDGDGLPKARHDGSSTWEFVGNPSSSPSNALSIDNVNMYGYPDNTFKCGYPSYRWTAVYAVNGTIQTSDATQKQQIRSLDEKELAVAKRIKGLIKTFKWNSSVAEKSDGARIHVGVIAQEVQAAFIAEGLDPSRYGMFCSDSWYAVDGDAGRPANPYTADTEGAVLVTQLGIRYDQLLSFVISAL
jgi:hypothetical protein